MKPTPTQDKESISTNEEVEKYNELINEVVDELQTLDTLFDETIVKCIEVSKHEVVAEISFKIPAFVYPDDTTELRNKLKRLREMTPKLFNHDSNIEEIDESLNALDRIEKSYDKEFDNTDEIDDLRNGIVPDLMEAGYQ